MTAYRTERGQRIRCPRSVGKYRRKLFPRGKKRRFRIISDRAEKDTTPACPNARKKPRLRGISNRMKRYNPWGLSKGGRKKIARQGKAVFRRKNAEKVRLFTEFFVDATGNGVMTFEQVGGAGEAFVGRKKSAGGDGGGGGGIGAAGCGLILWIGGRSRVNVFVVGGG